jgi:hypothetical protein
MNSTLRYGLVWAALSVLSIFATVELMEAHRWGWMDALGYASIVGAALFVFFGVRAHRRALGHRLTFGQGLRAGMAITLVATGVYVVAFQAVYFGVKPDFGQTYEECMAERARLAGVPDGKADADAAAMRRLFDQPLWNVLLSASLPLGTGLLASLLSAAILRSRAGAASDNR